MGVLQEIAGVRQEAGLWLRTDHTVLQFTGKDAASWLHNQTTNDVLRLENGAGNVHALLDRQGRVQCFFSLHRWDDAYWAVIARDQTQGILDRVESHLFLEEVQVEDVGGGEAQICIEGPRALFLLAHALNADAPEDAAATLPVAPHAFAPGMLEGHEVLIFRHSESGEDGFLILTAPGESSPVFDILQEAGLACNAVSVGAPAREVLRIEAGRPKYGPDIDATCVINETPLEAEAVSYDKGCYLGQEVVARMKTYGSPKLALTGLRLTGADVTLPKAGAVLEISGKRAGRLCSHSFSPTLGAHIALAYIGRDFRTPGDSHTFVCPDAGDSFAATITPLPFVEVPSREERARQYYDEALARFEQDSEDTDDSAIGLLREAILLSPAFEDAYEVLGVILHRHHRVDEAIGYMKHLAALNPRSVMARTNLSVFYMTQGRIQEAEDEKALAKQLENQVELNALAAKKQALEERQRIRAEAEERIGMFVEVLDIDPEDPVATMGLASAYIQLDRHADALPYLQIATRVKKDYSVAFMKLGQCHEVLGQLGDAKQVYRAGITAASRKGDLMPLREMERRLKALESQTEAPAE